MSQTLPTMFETIGPNWAATYHAYGPATDIPGLLQLLESDESLDRMDAMHELCGNVFHQGTRYPASAVIIPFLVALAANPAIYDRDSILGLLCHIALGYDHIYLPGGMDIASERRKLEERRQLDVEEEKRRLDQWVAEAADEKKRRKRQLKRDERVRTLSHDLKDMENAMMAYDAVKNQALPTLCYLLQNDSDPSVRAEAAHIIAFFPESVDETLPFVRSIVFDDSDGIPEGLLATATISFALLFAISPSSAPDRQTVEQRLHQFLTRENPSLRWAAATGLSRLDIVDAAIIRELATAAVNPLPETDPKIPFYQPELYALESLKAACTIPLLSDSTLKSAIDAILDGLSSPDTLGCDALLSTSCKVRRIRRKDSVERILRAAERS
jgi:HEAT repeat protein